MDIGKLFQKCLDLFKPNAVTLILACLVAGLVSGFSFYILLGPVMGGFLMLCFKLVKGETADFGEIFAHFDKFFPAFLLTLMVFAASFILLLIPIVNLLTMVALPLVSILYTFSLIQILENNLPLMDSIKKSIDIIKSNNPIMIWVLGIITIVLSSAGAIACGVGILVTSPFATLLLVVAYDELTGSAPVAPSTSIEA